MAKTHKHAPKSGAAVTWTDYSAMNVIAAILSADQSWREEDKNSAMQRLARVVLHTGRPVDGAF